MTQISFKTAQMSVLLYLLKSWTLRRAEVESVQIFISTYVACNS
jgi:hypothetical protein